MADTLKSIYSEAFLREFGHRIHAVYPPFRPEQFVTDTMDAAWDDRELKARMRQITLKLGAQLPSAFADAINILYAVDEECTGFAYLFFPDFVEVFGSNEADWSLAMQALERFTPKSSAEFAVRSFILREPERMMQQMEEWSRHPDEHVRRLASEGCRPRLPWGQALVPFKQDPTPILPILEQLKADPSLYVRKSVANNLNDIAKDHPERVLELARRWKGTHPHTDWIVRHGCRTLIRKAGPAALELFGYAQASEGKPLAISAAISAEPAAPQIGDSSELHYELTIRPGEPVKVRVEYGIDFVKSSGRTSRKLFLLSDKTIPGGARVNGSRRHSWADLSTRRHYPGEHRIVLLVNGLEVTSTLLWLAEGKP